MTKAPDPLDVAALVVLERLVADIRAERVFVTRVAAVDDEKDLSLALAWKVTSPSPSPASPASLEGGDPCPTCGNKLQETSSSIMCSRCGVVRQLSSG